MDRAIPGPLRAKGPRPLGTRVRVTGMTGMTARWTHAFGRHRVPLDRPFGRCVPAGMRGRPRRVPRCSRCGSLATLPRVALRPPPLTPAPPAERLRSMAPSSRHRSAVVAGRGLSRRVAERRRTTLPMGRVSSASAQPSLTCPDSRCLGNRLAPCRQDMDSVARNHLARLWRGGEPLRGRSRQRAKERAGTPVASRPKRSVVAPVLVLQRPALQLPESPHCRRYPAQREADGDAG